VDYSEVEYPVEWELATRLRAGPARFVARWRFGDFGGYWCVHVEGSRDGVPEHNVGVTFRLPGRNRLTVRWESPYRILYLEDHLDEAGLTFVFGPRWWKNTDGSWSAAVRQATGRPDEGPGTVSA
jgi:hypothetical protein